METLIGVVFIIGYSAIATEKYTTINKAASALLTGVICWVLIILSSPDKHQVAMRLSGHVSVISGILFFLMGAMTIVELIDAHNGFEVITNCITARSKVKLLWIIGLTAFFLSAILDNLTTTIVMIALTAKLIENKEDRPFYIGIIVIAANAGGAWTSIGDVTTTMLWIGGRITTVEIMLKLLAPSLVCLMVPLIIVSLSIKGAVETSQPHKSDSNQLERNVILFSGIAALMFVPVFKTITHLPPFMGMLFSLGVLWVLTELVHKRKNQEQKSSFSIARALQRIDMPSILFFLGILLSISALEETGLLKHLAKWLSDVFGNVYGIDLSIGLLSAVVDNVPLVAASMGMYDLMTYPVNHTFWIFLSYCAGTGGSVLIIGSAAGVAAMGSAKIDFFWYLRRITPLALLGYFAGAGVFILFQKIF